MARVGVEQALVQAERSLDFMNAVLRLATEAQRYAKAEMEEVEEMAAAARKAQRFTTSASKNCRSADRFSEAAQRLLTGNRLELDYRISKLIELNRPSFESMISSSIP